MTLCVYESVCVLCVVCVKEDGPHQQHCIHDNCHPVSEKLTATNKLPIHLFGESRGLLCTSRPLGWGFEPRAIPHSPRPEWDKEGRGKSTPREMSIDPLCITVNKVKKWQMLLVLLCLAVYCFVWIFTGRSVFSLLFTPWQTLLTA